MVRQTVFATFCCQSCSSCPCSDRDKRDAYWKRGHMHTHTHIHIDSQGGHECDPTKSDEVITADTGRAGDWRLEAVQQLNRSEYSVFLRKARGQEVLVPALVLSGGYRDTGSR